MKEARYIEPEYPMLYDWESENRQLEIDCGDKIFEGLMGQERESDPDVAVMPLSAAL